MTKVELIASINGLAKEYHGMDVYVGSLSSMKKSELINELDRWSSKVYHRNLYKHIVDSLSLTAHQKIAYSMGYKDALTLEQAFEYNRALAHYRLATNK